MPIGADPFAEGRAKRREYLFFGVLGGGAQGTVRLALHVPTARLRAVKKCERAGGGAGPASPGAAAVGVAAELAVRRRVAELPGADGWRHLVLPLVDDFETPSSHYLVFEHCGMDLAQYVASRGGALPEPEASAILVSVFSALAGLHAAGVAHRDLKPANILIRDARHPASSLCLGDFGSAHVGPLPPPDDGKLPSERLESEQTLVATSPRGAFPPPAPISRSTFTGTPYFLSPELVLGLPYGPGADVWAAGCTAHFLLTGRTPFSDSASLLELYNRIAGGALDLPAALSPAARAFLRATLDPHPETRITAREALEQPFLAPADADHSAARVESGQYVDLNADGELVLVSGPHGKEPEHPGVWWEEAVERARAAMDGLLAALQTV